MNQLFEYLVESYQDPMFLMFPVYTTILGVCIYLMFALPLSAIAFYDPKSLRKYKVTDRPIKVMEYFWPSLRKLITQNILLLGIVCLLWPLARNLGVHAGEMPPWYLIILQILLFLYVDDFLTYWAHKLLHKGWLYKNVHSIHHKVRNPSAMDNAYFHWIEHLMIVSTGQLLPVLMGANIYVIWIWLFIRIWQSVLGHCGYEFPWNPLRLIPLYEGADYHYFHHVDKRGNMSGILPYLDLIWGDVAPKYRVFKQKNPLNKKYNFLKLKW